MKKTKVIYALITSAMLSIAVTGCGSGTNETGEDYNIDIESTTTPAPTESVNLGSVTDPDDVTPTTEPTATSTPVPTETPTPEPTATSTPVPKETPVVQSDWFIENNIDILGAGDFTYEGSEWVEENGEYILKPCPGSGSVNFYVTDNGNGTTTYQAEFIVKGNRDDVDVAVADLYSGTIFKDAGYFGDPLLVSDPNVTLTDGTEVEFAIERWSVQGWGYDEATGEEAVVEFNVNCCVTVPSEYDSLIFVLRCRDVNREYNPALYFAD